MILKVLFLCFLFSNYTRAGTVLEFYNSRLAPSPFSLSSAVVTKVPKERLPDRFIICSTTKQSKIDGKSPIVIYGQANDPWLAFSFWKSDTGVVLWADVQKGSWGGFHHLATPYTHRWIHMCADVDTGSGNLTVVLDGQAPMTLNLEKLKTKKTEYLEDKIVIGLANTSGPVKNSQFVGSVTNLNIFHSNKGVQLLSLSKEKGDFMSWSDVGYEFMGDGITQVNCSIPEDQTEKYNLVLPMLTTWTEADQYCKRLGNGNMTEITNEEELISATDFVVGVMDSCTDLSLPISDAHHEGEYRKIDDGEMATYLPWWDTEPNGGTTENAVVLRLSLFGYFDVTLHTTQVCVSCSLHRTALFNLRGLCKDSTMGRYYIHYIHYIH